MKKSYFKKVFNSLIYEFKSLKKVKTNIKYKFD